jgi:perosamine synthetase
MPRSAVRAAGRVLRSGYIGEGAVTARFEAELARWLGEREVAVVNSCTSALDLALHLVGICPGSEVISSPLTCVATNTAILRRGADVRWADVDPRSGNMSAKSLAARITPRTTAVLFTDWGGVPADAGKIAEVARQHGLRVIRDAASGIGMHTRGQPPSTDADYVCYSFQAVKHITTVNGGALVTRHSDDGRRARLLRWYGLPRLAGRISMAAMDVDLREAGYKMHLDDVSSTIGLVQLEHVDRVLAAHRKNAQALRRTLLQTRHFAAQRVIEGAVPSDLFLTIVADAGQNREILSRVCQEMQIDSSIVHRRNDSYSLFERYRSELPGVDRFSRCALAVPCGWWVTARHLRRISRAIAEADRRAQ